MKRIILSAALLVATVGSLNAQTYQNDFQKVIGLETNGMVNYTLCETKDKGYAMVSFHESNGMDQNRVQIFKTDANLNVVMNQAFEYDATGLYGFEITPFDIYETRENGFVIAGGMINEGDMSQSGGFLLSIGNMKNQLTFDWLQIYPNDNSDSKVMPVQEIRRVVQMDDGYMTIARGKDALASGIVMKTDPYGNVKWTKHFYGTEYKGNRNSVLADMVRIDGEQVAVVGTVNGFPNDDADIQVIRITTAGEPLSHKVYEFQGEQKDPKYTYNEQGAAIEYNASKKELIIAGTVTKKVEGVCVTAEYKDIITFGVDISAEKVKWSTRHDIGADKTYELESFFCADVDFSEKGMAVAGTVKNRLNTKMTHYNGFILRLNPYAKSTDVRFYGAQNQDYLSRIYAKGSNAYVAGGMLNKSGTNLNWMIESFNSVQGDCLSKRTEATTKEHLLHIMEGGNRSVLVKHTESKMKIFKSPYFDDNICGKKATLNELTPKKESVKVVKSL